MMFVFPGQGSQFVGMGKALFDSFPAARGVFSEVDDSLGYELSKIIFSGTEEDLTLTRNAQPALMTVSIAAIRAMEHVIGAPINSLGIKYFAGHSVGEFTALCAAKSISLSDTAKILQARGDAMYAAVEHNTSGMIALIGGTIEEAYKVVEKASQYGICEIANDNGGGQIVISGTNEALDSISYLINGTGIKKAIKLKVSGPFHSSLMEPAKDKLHSALENVKIRNPIVPIIFNVTASLENDVGKIKPLMLEQIVKPVRWRETISFAINNGVNTLVEIGPGNVLTNLAKRIDPSLKLISLFEADQIYEFANYIESTNQDAVS